MTALLLTLCCPALAQDAPPEPPAALEEVRRVFDEVERFDGIEVTVSNGVLRLIGEAPTVAVRREAEQVASRVPDVLFVDNLVEVALEGAPATPDADDDAIEEHLTRVMGQIDELEDVQVRVTSGVAHLSGQVLDSDTRQRAVELTEQQPGVVWVEDDLEEATAVSTRLGPALRTARDQLQSMLARGPLFGVALAVLAGFALLARALQGWDALYWRARGRPLLRATLGRLVFGAVLLAGCLAALEIIDATALVGAVVGTAGVFGLAVGFAFKDIVENYLAGLLLSVQQPFSKDDLVEIDDVQGVVLKLDTRNTLLLTLDGNHVFLPNSTVFKGTLVNYMRNPHRRFGFAVGVGVDEDLAEVIATGLQTLREMPGVSDDPPPSVLIDQLGDSNVVMCVYGWVDQREHSFLAVRTEAVRRIKEAYDAAGYDMPEPIYRISVTQPGARPQPKAPDTRPAVDLDADDGLVRQAAEQREQEGGTDLLVDS